MSIKKYIVFIIILLFIYICYNNYLNQEKYILNNLNNIIKYLDTYNNFNTNLNNMNGGNQNNPNSLTQTESSNQKSQLEQYSQGTSERVKTAVDTKIAEEAAAQKVAEEAAQKKKEAQAAQADNEDTQAPNTQAADTQATDTQATDTQAADTQAADTQAAANTETSANIQASTPVALSNKFDSENNLNNKLNENVNFYNQNIIKKGIRSSEDILKELDILVNNTEKSNYNNINDRNILFMKELLVNIKNIKNEKLRDGLIKELEDKYKNNKLFTDFMGKIDNLTKKFNKRELIYTKDNIDNFLNRINTLTQKNKTSKLIRAWEGMVFKQDIIKKNKYDDLKLDLNDPIGTLQPYEEEDYHSF